MALCGVYVIQSISTGRFYYGSSTDCTKRKKGHLRSLRKGRHHSLFLQRVYNKYGEEDLRFALVVRCKTQEEALDTEQELILEHIDDVDCMNVAAGAGGGDNLTYNPRRRQIIAKMTKSVRAYVASLTPEARKIRFGQPGSSNGMWGKTHSSETRKLLSSLHTGNTYALGRKATAEQRARMAIAAKRREAAPGYVNGFKGRTHTEESRRLIAARQLERMKDPKNLPSNTRRVRVGKRTFRSLSKAAEYLGCVPATVLNRIRSDKFSDYSYID